MTWGKKSQRILNTASRATAVATNIDTDCINAIRFLAVDAINKSKSGHPGAPMGQAPIGFVLFSEEMNFNPADPDWINRDRFVLSSGHGCMLQYALLHLTGYSSVSMPCWELFREQPASYKEDLLPKNIPKMSVEAAVTMGWQEWADAMVGVDVFGAYAPGGTCLDKFGFNAANVVSCAERCMAGERGALSDGSQAKH